MPTATYAGHDVLVNDEGFLTDPAQWTEEMAPQIARSEGIAELTPRHWQVIRFMRTQYQAKGTGPTVRVLGKTSGVTVKELYQLFPKGAIEKVSIIVSKGSLEGIYPALIMANGARAEGIEANLFFTFFGLDAITKKRHEHIKVATVGNPGLHLATIVGSLPGMPGLMTSYLEHKMAKLDIPPIPEFIEMISDSGAGLYGCQASCDLFGISKDDLIEQVQGIITVGEFYAMAAGGQIIFT
jgi:TusE/DsrC/DsvC family sulfur relay protein